jgi:hypothetical protein
MNLPTLLLLLAPAAEGAAVPPLPRAPLILLDDRAVKEQASPALLLQAAAAITARTGVPVVLLSDAAKALADADQKALATCAARPCLAGVGKKLAADVVVTTRVQRTEGVYVLTLSRVTALAEVPFVEDARLARTEAELTTALTDSVNTVFPALGKKAAQPPGEQSSPKPPKQ